MTRYPEYWPETIRALIVHSARWTPKMLTDLGSATGKTERKALARRFGYGVPNLSRALASAQNDLALIAQKPIQPFRKEGSNIRFGDAMSIACPGRRKSSKN